MFTEVLIQKYGVNTPILSKDILNDFSNYTKAYVYRLINKAIDNGELIRYSNGSYFLPEKSYNFKSTITSEMVVEKKYLKSNCEVYGIYSGLVLLNTFCITTQVPSVYEITTNKESTRKRSITIKGQKYILRKSKVEINNDNFREYTLLQLFYDLSDDDKIDEISKILILKYIKEYKISFNKIILLSAFFTPKTLKRIIESEIFNGII